MRRVALFGLILVGAALSNGCGCSDDDDVNAAAGGRDAGAGTNGASGSGPDASGDAGASGTGGADAGLDFWTAWERARMALRTSPDHLLARADDVVKTKDPVKIFEFVRDQMRPTHRRPTASTAPSTLSAGEAAELCAAAQARPVKKPSSWSCSTSAPD
jgi:hypothetical protein